MPMKFLKIMKYRWYLRELRIYAKMLAYVEDQDTQCTVEDRIRTIVKSINNLNL